MLRSRLTWLFVTTALVAAPAGAQTVADALALAERAALEAERSAVAAADAARQARVAVEALRALQGQAGPAETATTPTSNPAPPLLSQASNDLSAEENVPVTNDTADREAVLFDVALSRTVANGVNDGLLKTTLSPDFQFTVSEKDKIASISASFDLSTTQRGTNLSTEQLTLTGSGKLNDDGERTFTDLKGFSKGTEVSFTYTAFSTGVTWGAPTEAYERAGVDTARQKCLSDQATSRASKLLLSPKPVTDEEREKAKKAEKDAAEADKKGVCNPYNPSNTGVSMFMQTYYPAGLEPLLDEMLSKHVKYWGFKAAGNQARYEYLDRTTFTEPKEDHFGWSASVFAGGLFKKGSTSVTGSFTYKKDYEAADEVTLCQPVSSTTYAQCFTSPDGKPSRKDQTILALEGRRAFSVNRDGNLSLAMAAEVSADVNNDAYSLVVPIYFASGEGGKLRGGLRGVYLNQKDEKNGGRDDEFSVGVFVGAPFSVFPQ